MLKNSYFMIKLRLVADFLRGCGRCTRKQEHSPHPLKKSVTKRNLIIRYSLLLLLAGGVGCALWPKIERPWLTVIGPVKMADGLGRQSIELMHTVCEEVGVGFIPTGKVHLTDVPPKVLSLLKPNKRLGHIVLYEAPLPTPNPKFYHRLNKTLRGPKQEKQIRIAYSMYEYSRIPPLWAESLNTYFDAVVVPDPFLVEVYQSSGVEIPVFVLPLGLDMDAFLQQPLKTAPHKPFCFLNASAMIPRKNHEGMIRAFHEAFGDNPDVQLVLHYRAAAGDALEKTTALIASLQAKNIILKNTPLNNREYLELFTQADAFFTLAKGEGFSIQPREAMALGLPVVLSANTAHTTLLDSGLVQGVPCPATQIGRNPYLKCVCGEEYIADEHAAALALRAVYENYTQHLEKAAQRRKWAQNYCFKQLKPLYLSLIHPKKVQLGKTNEITAEGLITTSEALYMKYKNLCNP